MHYHPTYETCQGEGAPSIPFLTHRHRDPFCLQPDLERGCLAGRTRFGDNIEDEWFIVALLMQLSTLHPTIAIQVVDNDGEFLLIEAGDVLDEWMQPDSTCNRVSCVAAWGPKGWRQWGWVHV